MKNRLEDYLAELLGILDCTASQIQRTEALLVLQQVQQVNSAYDEEMSKQDKPGNVCLVNMIMLLNPAATSTEMLDASQLLRNYRDAIKEEACLGPITKPVDETKV